MTSVEDLEAAIVAKGAEIREMKAQGQSIDQVKPCIDELLTLKQRYKEVSGKEYQNQSSCSGSNSNKKASEKKKVEKVKEKVKEEEENVGEGKKSKSQLKKEAKLAAKKADTIGGEEVSKGKLKKVKKEKVLETSRNPEVQSSEVSDISLLLRQCDFVNRINVSGGGDTQVVTPWDVEAEGGVDYDKLIAQFGCSPIDKSLIDRMEKLTGHKAHRYLRRGFFFSHRDLKTILDKYEKGEKFYLYTGRGPSSGSLHMGHLIPFTFTSWLQKVFDVPLVIQLTNDEKFLFKDQSLEESMKLMWENAKDIIACGFDEKKTFIFADTDYIKEMYPNILKVQKCVTYNQARGIFGFTGTDNIGKSAFPAVQAVPSFSSTFEVPLKGIKNMPCLIPQAIDQDPYFRMTRDVAPRIGYEKPSLIHSKFFPALQGSSSKMSASSSSSTIYVSDSPEEVANKIKKYAFSGGGETKADHEEFGANLDVDIPYQYLTFMMEDDEELAHIGREYGSGRMMTGEVKNRLIEIMCEYNESFQERRRRITDEQVRRYMTVRPLEF